MNLPATLVVLLLSVVPCCEAQVLAPVLVVVNQGDHTVSLFDPDASKVVGTVDVGEVTGHEAAVSPDGRTVYVPIYGDSGVGKPGADGHSLVAIDVASRRVTHTLRFDHGVRPHCIVYNPHDGLLYVTTEMDQTITLIDPKTMTIVGTIATTQPQSHMLALSHDGRFGYTANVGPGTVSVLDIKARKTVAVIPVSGNTQRIAVSNDDLTVLTADQTAPRLVVIDAGSRSVKRSIKLPAIGYGTAFTRDGRWLLVAMRPIHQVGVIDLKAMQLVRTIDVPKTPTEILVRPDGRVAYVSCGAKVALIDVATWTLASTLDAGQGADGLAWAN